MSSRTQRRSLIAFMGPGRYGLGLRVRESPLLTLLL